MVSIGWAHVSPCSAMEILQIYGVTLEKLIKAIPEHFKGFAEDHILVRRLEIEG